MSTPLSVLDTGAAGNGRVDDSSAIQRALIDSTPTVSIPPGVYLINRTLRIGTGKTILAAPDAIMRFGDGAGRNSNDFLLTNTDYESGNTNIEVRGGIWDGNNASNSRGEDGQANAYTGVALNFIHVCNLRIADLTVRNPDSFSIRLGQVSQFRIENIVFDHPITRPNQDGVHVGGFCEDGTILHLSASSPNTTNDDMVAFNADDDVKRAINLGMKRGFIRNMKVERLAGESVYTFVRLLSETQRLENITISDISGGCRCYAINLNCWKFLPGSGDIRNVDISNINVKKAGDAAAFPLVDIHLGVQNLTIEDFRRPLSDGSPSPTLLVENGWENSVELTGFSKGALERKSGKVLLGSGGIGRFHIDNNHLSFYSAMRFLQDMTLEVLEQSRVRPGQSAAGERPNATGGNLIRPGGRDCYPAFWIRDFAMSLECGLVPVDEIEHALRLMARCQAVKEWETESGSLVPRGAVADHITFDGKPIYFPGTIEYSRQGQPWGYYPSLDDHFFFIETAFHLAKRCERPEILEDTTTGMRIIDRLELAFSVPIVDEESGLVWCSENERGVSFGFTDIVMHTEKLLFCSILRFRAAVQLAELYSLINEHEKAMQYRLCAEGIAGQVRIAFHHESGFLCSSTGSSAQPDVWGSAFAIYSGILDESQVRKAALTLLNAVKSGTIAWKGNIRHVPTDWDFSETTAWERTVNNYPINTYQNGAYWGTPTGWVCYAIAEVDEAAARALALEYVEELREGDFRRGDEFGSPYECFHADGDYHQNPVYLTSVSCPLAAFQRLGWTARDDINASVEIP
ncbi:MAG: hypothetical protein HN368_13990 [Spirochaetales bacterium]|nr:hypothetical protein [Spirochaetales bacterium]